MSRYVLLAALCLLTGPGSALPNSVRLDKIRHEPQGPNNCGPITALTVLGSYGTRVTQAPAALTSCGDCWHAAFQWWCSSGSSRGATSRTSAQCTVTKGALPDQ
ncbi:hypothetical protein [Deinococcus geothermalis]|uniref:hypothetical protein n=1 Tax=Deinococcus geothermalis TaxID=68909 RepID=UPI002352F9B8|nr:hypothetical protein [Deinococcus geothermalis]